jgi:hypothetical protein
MDGRDVVVVQATNIILAYIVVMTRNSFKSFSRGESEKEEEEKGLRYISKRSIKPIMKSIPLIKFSCLSHSLSHINE